MTSFQFASSTMVETWATLVRSGWWGAMKGSTAARNRSIEGGCAAMQTKIKPAITVQCAGLSP